jgi:glycosyltransferase 2 family protein
MLWVFHQIQIDHLIGLFRRVSWGFLLCALCLEWVGYVTDCAKQYLVLRYSGSRSPFRLLLSLRFLGAFAGNVLPSSIAGDVVRAVGLGVQEEKHLDAWSSIFYSRYMGIVSVMIWVGLIGIAGSPFFPGDHVSVLSVWILTGIAGAGIILLSSKSVIQWLDTIRKRRGASDKLNKSLVIFGEFLVRIKKYRSPRVWISAILLSLLTQFIGIVSIFLLAFGLEAAPPFSFYAVMVPLVGLFSMLPLSINGFGLQDMGYLYFFEKNGFSKETAIVVSLLWHATRTFATLPGLFVFQRNMFKRNK